MLNVQGMLRAPSRKPTCNDVQNARKRVEYVRAQDQQTAKQIALAMPNNAAYRVSSIREARK